ncbi:MAG: hypothetical protein H7069_12500 [Phormidesmis sp. FL-bin-119]|nr:hypothetical protein [Pedobacter sp.]
MSLKIRIYFTGIVALGIWTLLLWDYFHGGVPTHHLAANGDLPGISNWWGALLLPLLTGYLLYRIQIRIGHGTNKEDQTLQNLKNIIPDFAWSLIFGILLSVFFTFGYTDLCLYMILTLLPLGLIFRIYRAECLLGFVLGMTYTFGTVLPTGIGCILVLIGAMLYLYLRVGLLSAFSRLSLKGS